MNNQRIARELVAVAKGLVAARMRYRIEEGYDHYNQYPLYRVVGVNNDYVGEWDSEERPIKRELRDLKRTGSVGFAKELTAATLIDEQGVDERLSGISEKMHVLTRAVQDSIGKKSLTRQSDRVMGEVYGLAKEIKEAYSGSNQYRGMGEPTGRLMLSISKDLFLIASLLEKMFEAQAVYDKEVATLMNRINGRMRGII